MGTNLRVLDVRPVLGVVALPVSPHAGALATALLGDSDLPRLFATSALVVKKGSTFSLQAGVTSRRVVRLESAAGRSVTDAVPCGRPMPRILCLEVAGLRGGYYVNRPSCVALVVKTATGQQRVNVGVGAACTGQSPPVGPSTP